MALSGAHFLGLKSCSFTLRGNRMKKQLAALAVGLVAMGASGLALADTLAKVKQSGVITVGHRDASIPFSYYDDKQRPVGYSMDLCARVVEAVERAVGRKLEVKYQLVTSANRIRCWLTVLWIWSAVPRPIMQIVKSRFLICRRHS